MTIKSIGYHNRADIGITLFQRFFTAGKGKASTLSHMRIILGACLLAAILPGSAAAQPSADSLAGKLKSGDTVYLLDSASREITGVFGKLSDSMMTLMVNGELRDYALTDIRQVTRRGGDPLWNGILVGALIGGAGSGAASQNVSLAISGAVIYGGIGAMIDKMVAGRVVVYRAAGVKSVAVAPVVGAGRRGVRVSVRF
jgi:hypothetical protein